MGSVSFQECLLLHTMMHVFQVRMLGMWPSQYVLHFWADCVLSLDLSQPHALLVVAMFCCNLDLQNMYHGE